MNRRACPRPGAPIELARVELARVAPAIVVLPLFDGANWTSSKFEQSWTSTITTFTAKLYIRDDS